MEFAKETKKNLILEIALFCLGIAIISLFYKSNVFLALLMVAIIAITTKLWRRKYDMSFFIVGATVGPTAEIVCVHFGAWQYASPFFLGIPLWLPIAWGFIAMLTKRIVAILVKN